MCCRGRTNKDTRLRTDMMGGLILFLPILFVGWGMSARPEICVRTVHSSLIRTDNRGRYLESVLVTRWTFDPKAELK